MLSAGPLGEACSSPDIAENGAVNGDTISTMSRKAANRPRRLERTVTGVMTARMRLVRAIQNRRHACSWFFEGNGNDPFEGGPCARD
jgi:hypothetical protein